MRKYRPAAAMILLVVYANFSVGCFRNYFKVIIPYSSTSIIDQIHISESYFILHQGYSAWHLNAIALNEEQTELSGELWELPANHLKYLTALPDQPNRYKPNKDDPTIEVHLYVSEYAESQNNRIIVPLSSILNVEIYDVDQKATNSSTAGSVVVLGLIAAIIALDIYIALNIDPWY